MIAYMPYARCPKEQRPPGIPLAYPWVSQGCEEGQREALQALGWIVVTDEEYDEFVTAHADVIDAWEASPKVGTPETKETATFAVDKDNIDQEVTGAAVTVITGGRSLWDNFASFDVGTSKFVPTVDGVWNLNGTITVRDIVGATSVAVDVYRNDELWFTVAFAEISGQTSIALPFSCDVDAYASSSHDFDLRIRLAPETATATVSGSDEETAWGMTLVAPLEQESPT